jgi:hypothetical protein
MAEFEEQWEGAAEPNEATDHTEVEAAGSEHVLICSVCGRDLIDQYLLFNGRPLCGVCSYALQSQVTGGRSVRRFLRASVFGVAAGTLGAALYYTVGRLTNHEYVIVSLLVGWMVGRAVARGSNHRGGRLYQCLAVFLAYAALAGAYVPPFLGAGNNGNAQPQAALKKAAPKGAQAPKAVPAKRAAEAADVAKAAPPAAPEAKDENGGGRRAEGDAPAKEAGKPAQAGAAQKPAAVPQEVAPGAPAGAGGLPNGPLSEQILFLMLAVLVLLIASLALPIVVNWNQPIGLVIIAVALVTAWRLNRRPNLVFEGPFQVPAQTTPEEPVQEEVPPHD